GPATSRPAARDRPARRRAPRPPVREVRRAPPRLRLGEHGGGPAAGRRSRPAPRGARWSRGARRRGRPLHLSHRPPRGGAGAVAGSSAPVETHGVSQRRLAVAALAVGMVAALLLTFPLPLRLASAVIEDGTSDAYQFTWNLWWVRESVVRLHRNPFFTPYLFYPDGVPLLFHTLCFTLGLVSVPLQLALPGGALGAYNALVIVAPALTVVAVALLAYEVTGDPWAALAGGVVTAITGAAVWNLTTLYLGCTYLLALVLWAWWRLHRRRRIADVVLVFVLLLALLFASQEYALMALALLAADT